MRASLMPWYGGVMPFVSLDEDQANVIMKCRNRNAQWLIYKQQVGLPLPCPSVKRSGASLELAPASFVLRRLRPDGFLLVLRHERARPQQAERLSRRPDDGVLIMWRGGQVVRLTSVMSCRYRRGVLPYVKVARSARARVTALLGSGAYCRDLCHSCPSFTIQVRRCLRARACAALRPPYC